MFGIISHNERTTNKKKALKDCPKILGPVLTSKDYEIF
jgi:hypothetical protein